MQTNPCPSTAHKLAYGLVLLFVAALTITGCGPRLEAQPERPADSQTLVVDLPPLYLDVDAAGDLNVGGAPLNDFVALLGGNFTNIDVDPLLVQFLTTSNIQHIQLHNTPTGLRLLANGEPLPSLGWDDASLMAVTETLTGLGAQVNPVVDKVLPLIQDMSVGVVIRLPVQEGAPPIPILVQGDRSAAASARKAQADFLALVGAPPLIRATLTYAPDGTFEIAGLTGADLAILGLPLQAIFTLAPGSVRQISDLGVETVTLSTNPEGIFIAINGRTLPHITWGDGEVNHALRLAAQMGLLRMLGSAERGIAVVDAIERMLPVVQAADVNLTIVFP